MIDNIIEFKPKIKEKTSDDIMDEAEHNPPKSKLEYLMLCKKVLEPDDYRDLLCAIMDAEIYNESEDEIKRITEKYFSFFR